MGCTEALFYLPTYYLKERIEFLEKVNIYLPHTNYPTNEQKFVAIMSVYNKSVTDTLGQFIYPCLNKSNTCTVDD